MHTTNLYFESHITIEPVYDERLDIFICISKKFGFKVADFLMKKRNIDTEERSKNDSFCSSRGSDYSEIRFRMLCLICELRAEKFKVWRYKIENTLMDSKYRDELSILC